MRYENNELIATWEGSDKLMYKLFLLPREELDEDEELESDEDECDALYLIGIDSGNVRRFEEVFDMADARLATAQRTQVAFLLRENGPVPADAQEALADYSTHFFEVAITPASGGFGEYESGLIGSQDAYDTAESCLDACRDGIGREIYEIGVDDLPEELDTISGSIHNSPGRVFGWIDDDGEAHYFGIEEA